MSKNWITMEPLPQPKSIADFAQFRHLHLTVMQHTSDRWTAHFDNVEVKDPWELMTFAERDFVGALFLFRAAAHFELNDRAHWRPIRTIKIPKDGKLVWMTLTGDIK
jgi:hypothetical protein